MKGKILKILMVLTILTSVFATGLAQTQVQTSSRKSANLDVILIETEPVPLRKGEYADVWVKVRNRGDAVAENVSLDYIAEYPFSVDPDRETSKYFGDIEQGDEYHARFKIRVDDNAVSGEHDLKFRTNTEVTTITHETPVDVRTREAVISVESVDVEEELIPPSMTREVSLDIKNLADSTMRNIDISLGLRPESGTQETDQMQMEGMETREEIPLITIGETTEKRVSSISPGETRTVTFPVKADSDADEEAYKVPVGLSYEDEMGNDFQKLEYTGITVGGEPQLEAGIANIDGHPVSGRTLDVSLRLINRGLSEAKFLRMDVKDGENFEIVGGSDVYVGHMEPDDFDSSTFEVFVEEGTETVEIPVELDYRDSEGNVVSDDQVVSFRTYTSEELDRFGLSDEGMSVVVIAVIAVVVIGGIIVYRRKKKRQKKILED